ncbi:MAG: hypothetical protein EOO96_00355 [Pedobacter sp.]|nr:MAG: hypothetical protein EOO96_00355 [Pedobacter sp.]
MLAKIKKLIFTAITIEIIGAMLVSFFFYTLFFGIEETKKLVEWLYPPMIIGCSVTYAFGWIIGNRITTNYQFKKWQGLVIIFALLLVGVFGGMLTLSLSANSDINEISDVFPVVLVFLAFGGLPTLILGLWLGNRLSKINVH